MKTKPKDYIIHTGLIEETIKDKERKKRLFLSDIIREGKTKDRPITDFPNQYEIKYLLGPNLSIVVKRLLPIEDIDRLDSTKIRKISQIKYYSQLINVGAGFDIQNENIIDQHFRDSLTIFYDANKLDMIAEFHFFYDNSAKVNYSRNTNLTLFEFNSKNKDLRMGNYNPAYIYNLLFDLLQKEKKASNYFRWRKGLGFGFNKQTI
jgi:hypothetical protein